MASDLGESRIIHLNYLKIRYLALSVSGTVFSIYINYSSEPLLLLFLKHDTITPFSVSIMMKD